MLSAVPGARAGATAGAGGRAQQSLSLNIGYFAARGEGGRVPGDTIVANLYAELPFALGYQVSDFNNVTFGAEWLIPLGKFLEAGVGVSYYPETVPSFYRDLVNDERQPRSRRTLKLRIVPITGDGPLPPDSAGARRSSRTSAPASAIVPWQVLARPASSWTRTCDIFRWDYTDSGTAVGPVIFGGVRVALSRTVALGGEIRYQMADAPLDPNVGFQGTRIDLGGMTYHGSVIFRF